MLFAELPVQPFLRFLQEVTLKQSKNKVVTFNVQKKKNKNFNWVLQTLCCG
jgi:hypothetical protein